MKKNELTWVLQSNAIGTDDQLSLINCIKNSGHKVELIRVIPFIHESADPLPKIEGSCVVYGSSGLMNLGRKANWFPCGWDGETFELDSVNQALGKLALNGEAIKTIWSKALETASANNWEKVFLRPVSETKEFPGKIYKIDQLRDWTKQLEMSGYFEANDNPAMIGPTLSLGREWRIFVVAGKQVTGCEYANQGIPEAVSALPIEVSDFVEQTLSVFTPAPCFVIDVAEVFTDSGIVLKVVEYNSINSSGFYACDKAAIVDELSKFALTVFGSQEP